MFASRRMAGATMAAAALAVTAVCATATTHLTPQAQAAEARIKMSGSTSIAPPLSAKLV